MGDIFVNDPNDLIENSLIIQDKLGIPVSATFNNTLVRPDQKNLDLWIENFKSLYHHKGIRSATIPHTHWVMTGQIQKEFPQLMIKNTILREVNTAADVAKQAEAGFNYINIDRDLVRDRDTLRKIKQVKEKYNVKIAILGNEGCVGSCPVMPEHFEFNNSRTSTGPQYFNDAISRISCPKWDITEPVTALKTANIPPWRQDWKEMLYYVDVIKMHGRESVAQLFSTMDIVKKFAKEEEILFSDFDEYIYDKNLEGKPIQAWREFIKNCKFDCWDCNKCDNLYEAKNGKPQITIKNIIVESICGAYTD